MSVIKINDLIEYNKDELQKVYEKTSKQVIWSQVKWYTNHNNVDLLKFLFEKNLILTKVNKKKEDGKDGKEKNKDDKKVDNDVFYKFCVTGKKELIEVFIENGFDCNNEEAAKAIYNSGNEDMIKYFIDIVSIYDIYVSLACSEGRNGILEYLVRKGVILSNAHLLTNAIENGELEMVKELIKHVPNYSNNIIHAVKNDKIEIVKYLLENQYDDHKDKLNESLTKACEKQNQDMISILREYGADFTKVAFDHICKSKNYDLVKLCLNKGARVLTNHYEFAIRMNDLNLLKILIKYGKQLRDHELCLACNNGDVTLVKYIIENSNINLYESKCIANAYKSGNKELLIYLLGTDVQIL